MNKDYIAPEPIELSDKQKLRLFKLILKNTLYKRIEWIYTGVMFSGKGEHREKIICYSGEKIGLSIQDRNRYCYTYISKSEYDLLKGIIEGKSQKIESQVKAIKESELALDYFETEVRSCLS